MLNDGKYVILFNFFDLSGKLSGQQKQGEFTISGGAITAADGIGRNMLPIGPLTQSTELRITHGLNNGYYEVRHEQSFRPRPLQKSETPTISHGPFAKFFKAFEKYLGSGMMNTKVNRQYWVPGLAGSSLDGKIVFIDARLPEVFKGFRTDKYLLIHEVTEKVLMDRLGFDYGYAHNLALAAEQYAVESDGLNWSEYEQHMWNFIHAYCMPNIVPKEKRPPLLDPDRVTHTRTIRDIMRHELRKSYKAKPGIRVASVAVINPDNGNLLMGRRNDNGLWTMPGGHLMTGESPLDGAKRELLEETGILAKKLKYLGSGFAKNEKGKNITVYSFVYDSPVKDTDTEQDPDEEVQEWEWISSRKMKTIAHHVPIEKNVTLKLLKTKDLTKNLRKSDLINEDNEDDKSDYSRAAEAIRKKDQSVTPQELQGFLDEAMDRRDYSAAGSVFAHPNHDSSHLDTILRRNDLMPWRMTEGFGGFQRKVFDRSSPLEDYNLVSDLFRNGKISDSQVSQLQDKIKANPDHPVAAGIIYKLSGNNNLSSQALEGMYKFIHQSPSITELMPSSIMSQYAKRLAAKPDLREDVVTTLAQSRSPLIRRLAAQHQNASPEIISALSKDRNKYVREAAEKRKTFHGIAENPKSVVVAMGTNNARKIRDFIALHGGSVHDKELKAAGLNLDSMKLAHLKGPKGYVKAEDVQNHIDVTPSNEYHYSFGKYGYDPDEDYSDEAHPQHDQYPKEERGSDGEDPININPEDEQRHSDEPSKVFQLNVTPDHVQKMKQAGVWDTFHSINKNSLDGTHPVAPVHGAGWVRYTDNPDGVFIDEIQSDIGSSLVKKARAHTNKLLESAKMTKKEAEDTMKQAEDSYPEEHYKKINDIVFGGKDPSEVLHEAFHQYLRDNGQIGKPVHIWGVTGKSKISMGHMSTAKGDIPAHMYRTYKQIPEKLGYTPAKYGELSTQKGKWSDTNKTYIESPVAIEQHNGPEDTMKTTLRKSEQEGYEAFMKSQWKEIDNWS